MTTGGVHARRCSPPRNNVDAKSSGGPNGRYRTGPSFPVVSAEGRIPKAPQEILKLFRVVPERYQLRAHFLGREPENVRSRGRSSVRGLPRSTRRASEHNDRRDPADNRYARRVLCGNRSRLPPLEPFSRYLAFVTQPRLGRDPRNPFSDIHGSGGLVKAGERKRQLAQEKCRLCKQSRTRSAIVVRQSQTARTTENVIREQPRVLRVRLFPKDVVVLQDREQLRSVNRERTKRVTVLEHMRQGARAGERAAQDCERVASFCQQGNRRIESMLVGSCDPARLADDRRKAGHRRLVQLRRLVGPVQAVGDHAVGMCLSHEEVVRRETFLRGLRSKHRPQERGLVITLNAVVPCSQPDAFDRGLDGTSRVVGEISSRSESSSRSSELERPARSKSGKPVDSRKGARFFEEGAVGVLSELTRLPWRRSVTDGRDARVMVGKAVSYDCAPRLKDC